MNCLIRRESVQDTRDTQDTPVRFMIMELMQDRVMELMKVKMVEDRGTAWGTVDVTCGTGMAMEAEESIGGPFYQSLYTYHQVTP